ncbi:MAG: JAB domain-containing protein [Clostridia bacterium]|nr:JAB domain-containing protein [Clostridia bacterium]
MKENPNSGHRNRLREKYLSGGIEFLKDHEVLELLLFYAIPRRDTNKIAHNLIDSFGSLKGVFDAPIDKLIKLEISENTAMYLKTFPSVLSSYYYDRYIIGNKYIRFEKLPEMFLDRFLHEENTDNYVMLLNTKHKKLFFGTVNYDHTDMESLVSKIVALSIRYDAYYVVVGKNHLNEDQNHEEFDKDFVRKLNSALGIVNVKLADYITFINNKTYSANRKQIKI